MPIRNSWIHVAIGLLPLMLTGCGSSTTGAIFHGASETSDTNSQSVHLDSKLQGSIKNNIYESPNGRLRIKLPDTASPREINDGFPSSAEGAWVVAFNYPNCRAFSVSEKLVNLKELSLSEWVTQNILKETEELGAIIKERKLLQTRYGPTIFMRVLLPQGGSCQITKYKQGKTSINMADTDLAICIIYHSGYIYRVSYAADVFYAAGYNPESVEPTLNRFFSGIEIVPDKL